MTTTWPVGRRSEINEWPDVDAIRRGIETGVCPWCDSGPFRVLAGHVTSRHGIDRYELRDLAVLPYTTSICHPDFSRRRVEINRELKLVPDRGTGARLRKRLSVAARKTMAANGRARGFKRGDHARPHPCVMCGETIPKGKRRTCSDGCLYASRRQPRPRTTRPHPCVICNADIPNGKRRTCSDECLSKVNVMNGRKSAVARRNAQRRPVA